MLESFDLLAAVLAVGAYLFGAVPFGLVVVRLAANKDVRAAGSGNIGATNVARVAGKKLGVITLALDVLKGVLPVLLGRALDVDGPALGLVALAAVLGHCFPVYLRFRGGKGVATGLGVFAALTPISAAVGALCYAIAFAVLRISSIGSFGLLVGTLATTALLAPPYWPLGAELLIGAIVVGRHRENIGRLLRGQESKLS